MRVSTVEFKISPYAIPGLKGVKMTKTNALLRISTIVCDELKVPHEKMMTKSRKREYVYCRQISMYLIRRHSPHISLKTLGEYFGGRDHTTAIHSIRTILNLMETDETIKEAVKSIEEKI